MNIPLSWLSDYVKLPKDTNVLTDKLTLVGHMLDKTVRKGTETVIDLELRGNRADMFGLIGVARDISAILKTPLKLPETSPLPKKDPKLPLLVIDKSAVDLVQRYAVLRMAVKVGPSPKWLIDRLELYGIPSICNVVDITNYVMVETGIPMHAFDYHKIAGEKLILRRGKNGEQFQTIQQGITVTLSNEDLVIADKNQAQTLNMIGGANSKATSETTEIILEAAVYNPASCRRSARRLKITTESGMRLEKHLDPEAVEFAMSRAFFLIKQLAEGKPLGLVSDYYPRPVKPKTIKFNPSETARLSGLDLNRKESDRILTGLEFEVRGDLVTVPTFRTDVESQADLVEEVVRIYGYDKISETPINGSTPTPATYPTYALGERLRDILTNLGLNEVITLTTVTTGDIALVNPPDPDLKWLRANIYPSLVQYAQRLTNMRQSQVALFEIGNTFTGSPTKYKEHTLLSIVVSANLPGILQKLESLLGVKELPLTYGSQEHFFWAEIDLDKLLPLVPKFIDPYSVVSQFPPIIEDINVNYSGNYGKLIDKIKRISSLIDQIDLVDNYDNKLTLRITYHSDDHQLSSEDIAPIREKLTALV